MYEGIANVTRANTRSLLLLNYRCSNCVLQNILLLLELAREASDVSRTYIVNCNCWSHTGTGTWYSYPIREKPS
jgi:hypothetical protein